MHLVHTSITSENNMGEILNLTKSIFDIKMTVKSSAIEKKSSPTRRFRKQIHLSYHHYFHVKKYYCKTQDFLRGNKFDLWSEVLI